MSKTIRCRATRHGEMWLASVPEHGVYGHGPTLATLRESLAQGLALIDVTAKVVITPVTPELERLRSTEAAREAALKKAVLALAEDRVAVRDIAAATGASAAKVAAIQAKPTRRRRRTATR